jgi:hypothetical protein
VRARPGAHSAQCRAPTRNWPLRFPTRLRSALYWTPVRWVRRTPPLTAALPWVTYLRTVPMGRRPGH